MMSSQESDFPEFLADQDDAGVDGGILTVTSASVSSGLSPCWLAVFRFL